MQACYILHYFGTADKTLTVAKNMEQELIDAKIDKKIFSIDTD
jgi:hypothetical protein